MKSHSGIRSFAEADRSRQGVLSYPCLLSAHENMLLTADQQEINIAHTPMKLTERDLREFIELLNAREVRFVIVGAFALAYHGYPRYTSGYRFLCRVLR